MSHCHLSQYVISTWKSFIFYEFSYLTSGDHSTIIQYLYSLSSGAGLRELEFVAFDVLLVAHLAFCKFVPIPKISSPFEFLLPAEVLRWLLSEWSTNVWDSLPLILVVETSETWFPWGLDVFSTGFTTWSIKMVTGLFWMFEFVPQCKEGSIHFYDSLPFDLFPLLRLFYLPCMLLGSGRVPVLWKLQRKSHLLVLAALWLQSFFLAFEVFLPH